MKFTLNSITLCFLALLTGCATTHDTMINTSKTQSRAPSTALTAEELRIQKAQQVMPALNEFYEWNNFKWLWSQQVDYKLAQQAVKEVADGLWQYSKLQVQSGALVDDRPLYWTRLAILAYMKQTPNQLSLSERSALAEVFENTSRGRSDLMYSKGTDKRILLTGFDPFLLDKNISQSNPSGLAALLFDGQIIEYTDNHGKKITAEINTAMIPVRYVDFDQGEVESLLSPFYATQSVDFISTISMGRSDFDLEHFPGLRRSATAPDNLNVYTGASKQNPLVPLLASKPLSDQEFVLFSLPYKAMQRAQGNYQINDNREVTTLTKTFSPNALAELSNETSVEGGGGGYLSNEISYRSILLRNKLQSSIPTGHIHTPRISGFNASTNKAITDQIEAMLVQALTTL